TLKKNASVPFCVQEKCVCPLLLVPFCFLLLVPQSPFACPAGYAGTCRFVMSLGKKPQVPAKGAWLCATCRRQQCEGVRRSTLGNYWQQNVRCFRACMVNLVFRG